MSKREYKFYWLVLSISIILVITNPSDRDYTSYLSKLSNSSIDKHRIEYSLKSAYCKSYDNTMRRDLCENLVKTSKQNNPYYLEEWLNGKGYRTFERKNLLLFSFYNVTWSTELNGDGSWSGGVLWHIGILGGFINLIHDSLTIVISLMFILIGIYIYKRKKEIKADG